MTEQDTKPGPWVFLVWAVVFLTSCLIAAAAWKTLGSFDVSTYTIGTEIEQLGATVSTLTEHYASLANLQKERVEIWGLAALVLGVSGGVASVLRAPQAVIVGLGGFAAVIFGATQIYDPQRSIQVLNTARSQLACVNPRIHALAELRRRTEPFVRNAHDTTTAALVPLVSASSSFAAQVSRFGTVQLALQDERQQALDAIELTLLIPFRDVSAELDRVYNHQMIVLSILNDIDVFLFDRPHAELTALRAQVIARRDGLEHAYTRLDAPHTMESRLMTAVSDYHNALLDSSAAISAGEAVSVHALALTQTLPSKIDQLARWPTAFETAISASHNAVNRIQNTVIGQIAAGGGAKAPINNIVSAAINKATGEGPNNVMGDPVESHADPAASHAVGSAGQPQRIPHPNVLALRAETEMAATDRTLADLRGVLALADTRQELLRNLIVTHLPVIDGTTRRLQADGAKLENATQEVEQTVSDATNAIAGADAILNQPAPTRLESEIETCLTPI